MRPMYENKLTLDEELLFADEICSTWSIHLQKMPLSYKLDFSVIRKNKIVAFAELKCRRVSKDKYPTYLIGLSKIISAQNIHKASKKPVMLCVKWTDCAGWIRLDDPDLQFDLAIGGRKDRQDWQDVEPICFIPIEQFNIIK